MVRLALLTALLMLAATAYMLLLRGSPTGDLPPERTLASPAAGRDRASIYLEVVGVDAIRDAMQVRVSLEPPSGADGSFPLPDRDVTLVLAHDRGGERIQVKAGQPSPVVSVELNLDGGDVTSYPFDAYHADLWIRGTVAGVTTPTPLPIDLTVWERALGYRLHTEIGVGGPGGERLTIGVRRSRAVVLFALVAYAAMFILACGALTIGLLVAFRVRRAEPTLVGALGAIVFALPALRNALPADAPLGVSADVLVFLWAEVAAVLALALLVATWARTGPRP